MGKLWTLSLAVGTLASEMDEMENELLSEDDELLEEVLVEELRLWRIGQAVNRPSGHNPKSNWTVPGGAPRIGKDLYNRPAKAVLRADNSAGADSADVPSPDTRVNCASSIDLKWRISLLTFLGRPSGSYGGTKSGCMSALATK
jgi:hypothetical protein